MILIIYILTPFIHHDLQHPPFSRLPHHPNSHDGACRHPWSSTKSEAEVNFGRMHGSHTPVGINASFPQSLFKTIFPVSKRLHPFHPHYEYDIGSAMHHTLDRECSRSRKYLQPTNERLVQAELALRYWREHDNLYIWAPIPIYTERADYRSLEMAIIQEWQPRLILKKPALNTKALFGLATLWRRAKHKFTPTLFRQILTSERFQNRLELWTIIHALGSSTKARFEQTKLLRSNDGGLTLCYALRRLANNIQEPFRTLSLNASDASIKWWKGKPAPKATPLRAPWSLTPNLQ